ncbi:hypothetical protein MTR_8g442530 [Medicago truncatula]|uniref:Uncharacterized protein n=1 Tax=Medicago truncatula TaxID=3880 RepID=A0A072TP29_MEDTR|nr:hypothetical protein MTR_8g442530 [Medicago truncatula]
MQLRDFHIDRGFVADSTTEAEMLEPKSLKLILQVVDVVSQAEQRHRHLTAHCGDLFNTSWLRIPLEGLRRPLEGLRRPREGILRSLASRNRLKYKNTPVA